MKGTTNKIEKVIATMQRVYGPFTPSSFSSKQAPWVPKPYSEYKGRYLWTDAYGVCNFISLYYETGDALYLDAADALIQNVHDTLGKDRSGKERLGSATDEAPLKGGLRIGKVDPEGSPDGDGQYFHYLTKWMFALNRMGIAKRDLAKYNTLAIQLAQSIHPYFVVSSAQRTGEVRRKRMYWKVSIDLRHPLVDSEGNLDPYDGYVTYRLLQQCSDAPETTLKKEIEDMKRMVDAKYKTYQSNDPLDLGETLWIAHWFPEEEWAKTLTKRAVDSLEGLWGSGYFSEKRSLRYRLAFREFGTTIGVQVTSDTAARERWVERVEEMHTFWESGDHLWERDRDITPVMYCTSLMPACCWKEYKRVPLA